MYKTACFILALFMVVGASTGTCAVEAKSARLNHVAVQANNSGILLEFNNSDVEQTAITKETGTYSAFAMPEEGITYDYGQPVLPMVSRFVAVPPDVGLELVVEADDPVVINLDHPPALNLDQSISSANMNLNPGQPQQAALYPPVYAEMTEPSIMRGVRMVKISTYPIQYDARNNRYLRRENIRTELRFTNDAPVNPVRNPHRKNLSRDFKNVMEHLVVNPQDIYRDDAEDLSPFAGHYLIACREEALILARNFIEWRRKAGYKMDLYAVSSGDGTNTQAIKTQIQRRYDAYLNAHQDPFDLLMLIGDYTNHEGCGTAASQWIIQPEVGESVWGGANHADYKFALLEGQNDGLHMDVGISRWASGSQGLMELNVLRTLAYEATPYMENTSWFTRGAVGSQHWGNSDLGHWHTSIHTTARWGVEVLKHLGYRDIRFQERYQHDQQGQVYGPWMTQQFDDRCSVLLERAENYYWRSHFNGPRPNVVFPIRICTSGHGEWSTWWITRSGDRNNLRGPVAATCEWGGPSITGENAIWLGMVNGVMLNDMPFGWGWVYSTISLETFLPNYNYGNRDLYHQVKTDSDTYGDPGIKPWRNVPRIVDVDHVAQVTESTRLIEVFVYDPEIEDPDEAGVEGARVTLYAPGVLPNNAAQYAAHEVWQQTIFADADGYARFVFNEEQGWEGDVIYVTVTGRDSEGRDLLPEFSQIDIENNIAAIEIFNYDLEEADGNGDGDVNPGETFTLSLTAVNTAQEGSVNGVSAVVSSLSPWITVANNEITFGSLEAGEEVAGNGTATMRFHASCPDGEARPSTRPKLLVVFRSGEDTWSSAITLDPVAPNFTVRSIPRGIVIPDSIYRLDIDLQNVGRLNSPPISARLVTRGMGVGVVEPDVVYNALNAGAHATIRDNGFFLISGNSVVVPGSMTSMMLILSNEANFVDTAYFELQVRTPRVNAPLGPDRYGYICFDDSDTAWAMAPEYRWVEIATVERDHDFEGTDLNIRILDIPVPQSPQIGETAVIPLPLKDDGSRFQFQFYGYLYDTITVCTNGFITPGAQPLMHNSTNWPMDKAMGGGAGQIAPFWDWLQYGQNGKVYTYYDEDDNRFIVEWYKMRHRTGGQADLSFQVILYDHAVWITESGDQNILFQYRTISQAQGPHDEPQNTIWAVNIPYASVGISSPDGNSGINYTFNNIYPTPAKPLQNQMAMMFSTSPRYKACILYGHVRNFENSQPIQGAVVITKHGFTAITDEEGYFRINGALAEVPFDITTRAQGYNDSTEYGLEVLEDDSLRIDFDLLHPEFSPTRWRLIQSLDPGLQLDLRFSLNNTGNGPLYWNVDRRLLGDANADPWEFRRTYHYGDSARDTRLQGVIFTGQEFYVSGSGNADRTPRIYVFDRNGVFVRSFEQPRVEGDDRGMRDLAWDGELIWGAVSLRGNQVFGITRDGEVRHQWNGPYQPATAITWDPVHEVLWLATTTDKPLPFTVEGQRANFPDVIRGDLRIYGLAYWPDDPDRKGLYILHKERETDRQTLHRVNVDSGGAPEFVTYLQPAQGGAPEGAFITNKFDVYSWVLMSVANQPPDSGGDRVDIWQLAARKDWYQIDILKNNRRVEAKAETLQTGQRNDFILHLSSIDLPETTFVAELFFQHNADSGRGHIGVELNVVGPVQPTPFALASPLNLDTLSFDNPIVRFAWLPTFDPNFRDSPFYVFWIKTDNDSIGMACNDTSLVINLDTLSFNREWMYRNFTQWWVEVFSGADRIECDSRFNFVMDPYARLDDLGGIPVEFKIAAIYPSPFNSTTRIQFGVDRAERTRIMLYDVTGRLVETVFDQVPSVGWHTIILDGSRLPSGIYWVKLESGGRVKIAKTALMK